MLQNKKLQVKNLACERSHRQLFHGLSFTLSPGETLAVNGANGAGKTTLLRILAGLYEEYEGEVHWQLEEYPLYIGHRVGVKDLLTARENLTWAARLCGNDVTGSGMEDALRAVALQGYEDVQCAAMSEGQRRRVSLARLFMLKNPMWILDEPFSAIDKKGVASLEACMGRHLEAGGMVILASHQPISIADVQTIDLSSR